MTVWEVSAFPEGTEPTEAQRRAAADLVERCYEAAIRNGWQGFEKATADGFTALFQDRRHYGNQKFVTDGIMLDPDKPEFLMYYDSPQAKQLIGVMFYTNELLEHGYQFGGPLSLWHYHKWKKFTCLRSNLVPIGQAEALSRCLVGVPSHRSPRCCTSG